MSPAQLQLATCTIKRSMNRHGALTLVSANGCRTFHVVEYGSPAVQAALARRNRGEAVRVSLKRVIGRGEVWRVTELDPTVARAKPRQSPSPTKPADSAQSSSRRLPPLR